MFEPEQEDWDRKVWTILGSHLLLTVVSSVAVSYNRIINMSMGENLTNDVKNRLFKEILYK
jgi:hypothetical protein